MFVRSSIHNRRLFSSLPVYLAPDDGGGAGGAGGGDGGDGDSGAAGDKDRTFTQADVDRIAGRRASEGEKAATRKLMEDLGVTDAKEAKRLLDAARAADEKNKTDLQKAQDLAAQHETSAQQSKREAAEAKLQLKIDRKLLKAGADTGRLERISKNVFIDLPDDADDSAIDTAIEAMKSETPEWFKTDDSGDTTKPKKTGPAPSGKAQDGKGPKPGGTTESALDRGRERARRLQNKPAPTNA